MVGHWIAFALIIPLIPFSLVFSFVKFGKLNEQSENDKQRIYATIVKTTLYFWFLDLFYMSCFTNWTLGKYLNGCRRTKSCGVLYLMCPLLTHSPFPELPYADRPSKHLASTIFVLNTFFRRNKK